MNDKIQNLLEQAEQQEQSSKSGESSVSSASRTLSGVSEADNLFIHLKQKLFHVRKWNAESGLSSFELFDENGNLCDREFVAVGDFIRISLAGSGKNDWVKITDIYEEFDAVIVTVQPSYNPTEKPPDKTAISHFFTPDSTNNFCLAKNGKTVSFYVIGLNEKTNTKRTENLIETVRNIATSNIGYYLGIQKGEWKLFCENFLELKN